MNEVLAPFRWLLASPVRTGPGNAFLWWEARRIPVNLLIGVYGIICLVIFFTSIEHAHVLKPGEDAEEPIALILAPFAFNFCYTFGWIIEALVRAASPNTTPRLGPRLMAAGLAFSLLIISLPAVFWAGYVFFRYLGVAK